MAGRRGDRLRIAVDFDDRGIRAAERTIKSVGDRVRKKPIVQKLDFDYDRTKMAAFTDDVDDTNRSLTRTNRSAQGAAGGVSALSKAVKRVTPSLFQFKTRIPIVGLTVMGTAAYNAAGGAIALAGALAPMTGLLGAVGPLATAAAQGLNTIKLATAGIGDAISSAFAEQDKAATSSASSLQAQEAAAEGVRQAQLSLADAHRTARDAEEQLTIARGDATREIEDMRAAVRSLAFEEEGATLSLREAKAAFAELSKTGAGELEIEQASERIRVAREELRKTREESRRTSKDLGAVEAGGGVKGMPQVVAARRSLADANRGVVEAEKQVALAIRQSAQAMQATSGAADTLKSKMDALSPPARRFAEFIIGLRPQLKRLQGIAAKGLFPGVQKGITSAMKNLPVLEGIIARTSKALGDLAEQAGRRLGSQEWGKDLEIQGARNEVTITRLGKAGLNLAEAFKDVTLAAGPLVSRLTKWILALTEGWKESANASRESGKLQRFFKDAGDTFFKTVKILTNLAVSFKNIGSAARQAFGNELLGSIEKGARLLREWTGSVRGQRELVEVFKDIGDNLKAVGRFIRDLVGDFRAMKQEGMTTGEALGHIFTDVFVGAITEALESGDNIAKALVRGFFNADIWGKLIGGAFLISKFGGVAAWTAIGRKLGLGLGAGVAQGTTAGVVGGAGAGAAAGGLLGRIGAKLLPIAKRVGIVGLGIALADTTLKEFSRRTAEKGPDAMKALDALKGPETPGFVKSLFPPIDAAFKKLTQGDTEKAAKRLQDALRGIAEEGKAIDFNQARKLREEIARLPKLSDEAREGLQKIVDVGLENPASKLKLGMNRLKNRLAGDAKGIVDVTRNNLKLLPQIMDVHSKRGQQKVSENMRLTASAIVDSMDKGGTSAKQGMRAIRTAFVLNSQASKETVHKNFGLAKDAIRDAVKAGVLTSQQGTRQIAKVFKKYMGMLGFTSRDTELYLRGHDPKAGGEGKIGMPQTGQTGLVVKGGAPVGDTVPALLERGEVVINRRAVQAMGGPHVVDQVNKRFPRFQTGGIVALGRKLQREGYMVGEHPAFGGVDPVHVPNSYHYKGQALDINADNFPGGEMSALDKLYSRLKGMPGVIELLWRVANHFDHLHVAMAGSGDLSGLGGLAAQIKKIGKQKVGGPDSALKAGIQSGLDTVRRASNDKLAAAAATIGVEGAEPGVVGTGPKKGAASRAQMVKWARSALEQTAIFPASDENVEKILTLAMKESSWITDSINLWDSNAAAGNPSGGLMHITIDKVGGSKKRLFDPVDNIATSIRYQKSRYGELVTHSPYAAGGLVGYVGDSLGVGTAPKLKGRIGDLVANVAESRTSAQGLKVLKGMLGKKYARYIWDLGTNDGDAGAVSSNLRAADKATGDRLLLASTVTGANAKAKNSALHALAGGDINLFEWAKRSQGLLEGDVHPDPAGYSKRAAMMAGALKAATSRHKGKGKDQGNLPKLKGTLTQKTRQTAKALANSKDKKRRAKILKRFQKHLKGLGLPNKLLGEINFQLAAHDRYSDFADSAMAGDITNDDGSILKGIIQGKNEGDWLAEDLKAMFSARNKLVKAKGIVTVNQGKVEKTLRWVSELLKGYSKDGNTPRKWEGPNPATGPVEKWNKQPAPKRHRLRKEWKDKKGKLPGTREWNDHTGKVTEVPKGRVSAYKTLKTKLDNQNTELIGAISPGAVDGPSIVPQLEGLQGFGPPQILKSPWPRGTVWGGDILTTQDRILELFKVPPATTDDTSASDDARVPLLEQLLREANLRTAISERQFDVLRNFPPFGGQFATGGVVPGPAGAPRTVIAHGGETIVPEGKGGATPNVYVNFDGKVSFLRDFVDVRIEQQTRKATNRGRVLPGRKGGN